MYRDDDFIAGGLDDMPVIGKEKNRTYDSYLLLLFDKYPNIKKVYDEQMDLIEKCLECNNKLTSEEQRELFEYFKLQQCVMYNNKTKDGSNYV